MLSEHTPVRSSQCSGNCTVAVLDSTEVSEEAHIHCLSGKEIKKIAGIKNKKRRSEWLAGRLAAKYLFLNLMNMNITDIKTGGDKQSHPTLLKLTSEMLRSFSPWMYRRMEVLPNNMTQSGYPHLTWDGNHSKIHVSLSHTSGMACACIASAGAIGIDMELAIPRIESFYKGNFTSLERNWAMRSGNTVDIAANWLFTLLWTIKESALKSRISNEISVWDFPRIEIKILSERDYILASFNNTRFDNNFLIFGANINEQNRSRYAQVALTATRNLILTVIKI